MVYVDNMRAWYRGMYMSHMIADTSDELHAMADLIGVARKWCQYPGTYREHYDISETKRVAAVRCGAKEVTSRELGRILRARKVTPPTPALPTSTPNAKECA